MINRSGDPNPLPSHPPPNWGKKRGSSATLGHPCEILFPRWAFLPGAGRKGQSQPGWLQPQEDPRSGSLSWSMSSLWEAPLIFIQSIFYLFSCNRFLRVPPLPGVLWGDGEIQMLPDQGGRIPRKVADFLRKWSCDLLSSSTWLIHFKAMWGSLPSTISSLLLFAGCGNSSLLHSWAFFLLKAHCTFHFSDLADLMLACAPVGRFTSSSLLKTKTSSYKFISCL